MVINAHIQVTSHVKISQEKDQVARTLSLGSNSRIKDGPGGINFTTIIYYKKNLLFESLFLDNVSPLSGSTPLDCSGSEKHSLAGSINIT